MSEVTISMVKCATDTETRDVRLQKVLGAIRTGGTWLRDQVEKIRIQFDAELRKHGGDLKTAKRAIEPLKKSLPAIMGCGQFLSREQPAADKLQKHSGLFIADFDDLGDKLPLLRKKLKRSPYVLAFFLSPSGNGLKAFFRVPADANKHAGSFRAIEAHVKKLTGIQIDESGKDISRLCFMSYDPGLYINEKAQEIVPLPEPEKPKPDASDRAERISKPGKAEVREMLAVIPKRPHYHDWIKLCAAVGDALPHEDAVELLNEWSPEEEPDEYAKKLASGFEKIHVGTLFHVAKQHGWTPSSPAARKSAATELVELAEEYAFFHDDQDRPFIRLGKDGHTEIWPVESTKFRKLLARAYYKKNKKAVNRNAIADAITTLAGKACHDGGEEPVFLRVAPHDGNILIDLCDEQWRVVEVTPEGWRILDKSPVAFIRTGSMQALPEPLQGSGDITPLWKLLNVSEAQRPLVIGSLLNAFDPEGPYFVTNYVGEHGTAKSSASRIERQLVDPSSNPLRSPPKEERDLISQAASNWVVAMDNLSYLQSWLSDAICRLATGGGHSARTLYTDLEEISLAVKRPVFLNGIEDVAVRPDLADRALQIELEEIPKENRMLEKVLWSQLDRHKSEIFTAILDGLSCALRNRPKIKIKYLPRMADAVTWVTAGETSFGFKRETFLKAYAKNLDESAAAAIEFHPVGMAITQLLEKQDEWSGTSTELLEALGVVVGDEQKRKTKEWPKNARSLGHALRRLAPALRRAGFDYQRTPREAGRRIIVLSKRCQDPKTSSQTSQTSFAKEEPESATSSHFGTESATSSWVPQGNDDNDDHDVLFPTMHVSTSGSDHQGLDEAPPGPASVPSTITQEMASALQANGYSQPAICKMTPGEAHRILSSSPGSKAVSGDLKL